MLGAPVILTRHLIAAVALCTAFAACAGSGREPKTRPLPPPDGREPLLTPGPRSSRIASYRIDARYDPDTHRITASQTLRWKNTGESAVSQMPFHLYLNAFKNENSVFLRESRGRHRRAKASKDGWGWIEVKRIERLDSDVDLRPGARYPGPDETVLEVPLDRELEPGQVIELEIEFEAQLPEVFARTGFKGDFAMVGQWFPKVGVRIGEPGNETWHCKPFHLMSEFFADFGTYDVSLTVPDTLVVAASGVLVLARDNGDGTRTHQYRAEDVHDFAWMADPYMESISAIAHNRLGDVEVRVYFRPEQREFAQRHLSAGVGSIEIFSRMYVAYPWPIMRIIDPPLDAASGTGGMEYPTLVTTAGDSAFSPPGVRIPEFVTVHEVGHNWFQGILASNEVEEAWLDEGINEYADGLVMAELYGEAASAIDWSSIHVDFYRLRNALGIPYHNLPDPIWTPSYAFADYGAYGSATYAKTALAMRTLENLYGPDRVRAAMRVYAQRYAFEHPEGKDLFSTLEQQLSADLDWFVEPAFKGTGVVDLRVRSVQCRRKRKPRGIFGEGDDRRTQDDDKDDSDESAPWLCDVLVVNLGEVPAPVDVEIERSSRVKAVTIDPRHHVLLNDSGIARSWRRVPDTSASRRAAARAQFWTQTVMQVTGL